MQDYMQYLPHMQEIKSDILFKVLDETQNYDETKYSAKGVQEALNATHLSIEDLKALLSSAAEDSIEELAFKSAKVKQKCFGNSISPFTPLYLSNYCSSKCVYYGFQKGNKIAGAKLSKDKIHEEMQAIAKTGLQEILMLTGEGREFTSVEYIAKACKIARQYFKVAGVEIYPMNEDEYKILHENGCDYVTIFQEIYNPLKYSKIHSGGEKRVFPYRFNGQERALRAGMQGVAFTTFLGIDDFRRDALATTLHAYSLQEACPHAEISISVPRLRPIINNAKIHPKDVSEKHLLQVLCAYRLFLPFTGITISSCERVGFRDEVVKLGATKMNAGVSMGIREHKGEKKGDGQSEISDDRGVNEILAMLKNSNSQAMMSDNIYVG